MDWRERCSTPDWRTEPISRRNIGLRCRCTTAALWESASSNTVISIRWGLFSQPDKHLLAMSDSRHANGNSDALI